MAANLSKKFSLLICCLMTMQALRLVISTAGFCAVRFHIDCSLFNIFISRLVNAVLMSQLFGNWLGDIIVFSADGHSKLIGLTLANWAEFLCFCSALICICHTEVGHLTGFYWSMVLAYFWWKVGEAPAISIAVAEVDYYFAGFTLSGVWAAMLKGVVMIWCGKEKGLHSEALGLVNVKVVGTVSAVGARSVKTTVDYRAAKWLFITTIVIDFFMCLTWSVAVGVISDNGRDFVKDALNAKKEKELKAAIKAVPNATSWEGTVSTVDNARKAPGTNGKDQNAMKVEITLSTETSALDNGKVQKKIEKHVPSVAGGIMGVDASQASTNAKKIVVEVATAGSVEKGGAWALLVVTAIVFGAMMAVPGALMFATLGRWCHSIGITWWAIIGGVVGLIATAVPFVVAGVTSASDGETWVPFFKWGTVVQKPLEGKGLGWPGGGLLAGLMVGLMVGLIVACWKPRLGGSPLPAGAFFGSFFGLWTGEIVNGVLSWQKKDAPGNAIQADDGERYVIVVCGFFIVVFGLGTVYSIYPGMAPCSITQFQYFNIIDILILILSSSGPLVTMGLDLAEVDVRLGGSIRRDTDLGDTGTNTAMQIWVGSGVVLLIATNICEIIVLDIMQHPFSKTAQRVTTKGWLAVFLTVTMVTSQLVSTGVGFGCVSAGSAFNDGVYNALSTVTLWTTECCGVLGEGYLTELKKYEPGKWPTQGMGKWATYWWWNRKAFGNAWQIWCCIGTTDLRRDIMLCRQ